MSCKSKNIRKPIRKGALGLISGIVQAANTGSTYGQTVQQRSVKEDGYIDENEYQWGEALQTNFNPLKTFIANKQSGATGKELAVSLIPGVGGLLSGKMEARRLNEEREAKERQAQIDQYNSINNTVYNQGLINPYNSLMPMGGRVGFETVELEQGEPYMMPDGSMQAISTEAPSHAQGGVPITLPAGTKVLGKKEMYKGKQFKQIGRKIVKEHNKHQKNLEENPTSIASRTSKLMLNKLEDQFAGLFEAQGVDTGMDNQYTKGGTVGTPEYEQEFIHYPQPATATDYLNLLPNWNKYMTLLATKVATGIAGLYNPQVEQSMQSDGSNIMNWNPNPQNNWNMMSSVKQSTKSNTKPILNPKTKGTKTTASKTETFPALVSDPNMGSETVLQDTSLQQELGTPIAIYNQQKSPWSTQLPPNTSSDYVSTDTRGNNFNNALYTLGSVAPALYNLGMSLRKPQKLAMPKEYQNPYNDTIRSTMANRRYNINPELEANREAQATYYNQLRQAGLNPNQLIGSLQGGAINKMRADASAYARKQNVDNDYLMQQAQMDAQLGRDIVANKNQALSNRMTVQNINDANAAARRNYASAGLSQLSQFSQNQQLMNNQMVRDAQRLGLLPSLIQNFTFNPDGTWKFKETGETMNWDQIMNFLKGKK